MTDLLTRLESATEGQEADILADAWDYCAKRDEPHDRTVLAAKAGRFAALICADAWTSAAEMLLPEGQDQYDITTMYGIARVKLYINPTGDQFHGEHPGGANFVWAALAAACVKVGQLK